MKKLEVNEDFNFNDEDFDGILDSTLEKIKFYKKIVNYFPYLASYSNSIERKKKIVNICKELVEDLGYDIYGNRVGTPNRMTKLHIGPKENPKEFTYLAHVGFINSTKLVFDIFSKIEKYMFNSDNMSKRAHNEFEAYKKSTSKGLHESFDFDNEEFCNITDLSIEKNKFYRSIVKEFYKISRLHKQTGNEMTIWKKALTIIHDILVSVGGDLMKIGRNDENLSFPFRFKAYDHVWYKLPNSPFLHTLCTIDNSPVSHNKLFDIIKKIEKKLFNSTEKTELAAKKYMSLSKEELKALKESFDFEEELNIDKEIHQINLDKKIQNFAKTLIELSDEYGLKSPYDLFDYSIGMMDLSFICEKILFPEEEGFQIEYGHERVQDKDQIATRIMTDYGMSEILTPSTGPKITNVVDFFCRWFDYPFERAEKILEKENQIFLHKK